MSDTARKVLLLFAIGLLVAVVLRQRADMNWRELRGRLSVLIWPPLSAFKHSAHPGRDRAWWTLRIVFTVAAGLVLVFEMWRTGFHYEGPDAITGRP